MQAIIFDMDGTLIDTERISQASWRAAASELGIEIPERILHAFRRPLHEDRPHHDR